MVSLSGTCSTNLHILDDVSTAQLLWSPFLLRVNGELKRDCMTCYVQFGCLFWQNVRLQALLSTSGAYSVVGEVYVLIYDGLHDA